MQDAKEMYYRQKNFYVFHRRELVWTWLSADGMEERNAGLIIPVQRLCRNVSVGLALLEKAERSDVSLHPFMSHFSTIIGVLMLQSFNTQAANTAALHVATRLQFFWLKSNCLVLTLTFFFLKTKHNAQNPKFHVHSELNAWMCSGDVHPDNILCISHFQHLCCQLKGRNRSSFFPYWWIFTGKKCYIFCCITSSFEINSPVEKYSKAFSCSFTKY